MLLTTALMIRLAPQNVAKRLIVPPNFANHALFGEEPAMLISATKIVFTGTHLPSDDGSVKFFSDSRLPVGPDPV